MATALQITLHVLVAALLPPLLLGVVNKTKAAFAGRVGPPLLQPYYDLAKLLRKDSVVSVTTSWVFRAGPVICLATVGLALLLVPLGGAEAPLAFPGDLIVALYLLGLGRFFTAAAALDTGSSFEGMGAAREVTFACLAEPALLFGFLATSKLAGGALSLTDMLTGAPPTGLGSAMAALALVALSWFIVVLAENCRIPFDDPNTHLELTMIHEVMVLDQSGPALAMILYGAALKFFLFGALLVRLVLPLPIDRPWLSWTGFVAAMLVVALLVGVVESIMARLRLVHVSRLLVAACLLSAFGGLLLMR